MARKGSGEADPAFGQKGLTQPFLAAGADAAAVPLPVPRAESSGSARHQPVGWLCFRGADELQPKGLAETSSPFLWGRNSLFLQPGIC